MAFDPPHGQGVSPTSPPYTPTRADSTVIAGGMAGLRPRNPGLSTAFRSIVGGSGGLGRKPSTSKRALIGGT